MKSLAEQVDHVAAETGFSGVVRLDVGSSVEFEKAYGLADRRHRIANTVDTRLALASGAKGFTALTVVSLIVDGMLDLSTPVRQLLADDLPLIDDRVTVEQLLRHTSGIGDYFDEESDAEVTDYQLAVPVHELATTEQYLAVLDGYPQAFEPGTRFAYCNGGFVVLALVAERAAGLPFADLVTQRVVVPADLPDTAFLRSDELPPRAALGYLEADGLRTNVLHLPVVGSGDGGIYSTAHDISALWRAFLAGRVVPTEWVEAMTRPSELKPDDSRRYGLGFWLDGATDAVALTGYDAGVSFYSEHSPSLGRTHTVIANSTEGAWAVVEQLGEYLGLE